jgi:HSP20 family protein
MAESEIKVKTASEETGAVAKRAFETPFFGSSWFDLNPFMLMKKFTQEMDRAYHTALSDKGVWVPVLEVKEEGGKFRVSAELPGVKPEDVKVHVTEDTVILEGERKHEKEEKHEGLYHSERSYGHFYRSIPLPKGANTDKASAAYSNGVLEVAIPIPESKSKTRELHIRQAA